VEESDGNVGDSDGNVGDSDGNVGDDKKVECEKMYDSDYSDSDLSSEEDEDDGGDSISDTDSDKIVHRRCGSKVLRPQKKKNYFNPIPCPVRKKRSSRVVTQEQTTSPLPVIVRDVVLSHRTSTLSSQAKAQIALIARDVRIAKHQLTSVDYKYHILTFLRVIFTSTTKVAVSCLWFGGEVMQWILLLILLLCIATVGVFSFGTWLLKIGRTNLIGFVDICSEIYEVWQSQDRQPRQTRSTVTIEEIQDELDQLRLGYRPQYWVVPYRPQ
jgi:hypothetical protein